MAALKFAFGVWGVSALLLPILLTTEQFDRMGWDLKIAMYIGPGVLLALVAWAVFKKCKQMGKP